MNYKDAQDFLYGLQAFGIKLGLRNITRLLHEIDDPHRRFPAIHIAGTNGKGSVAALVESVLRTAGYRTGLFTSPHLIDFTERIRVNGRPIPRGKVSAGVALLKPSIQRYRCTFFEAATALAFHHFCEEQVDVAVVEVGMGGRLDATNVISPLCTIITDIDNDHTDYLGDRLRNIAQEKAAVIKENGLVITSVTDPEIMEVLNATCHRKGATLYTTAEHCSLKVREVTPGGSLLDARAHFRSYPDLQLPLVGRHQLRNLGAALLALDVLRENGFAASELTIKEGVARTAWPGRLQILQERPLFILDGAHNPGGIRALKGALQELFTYDNLILIFGVMANKNYSEMVETIVPLARRVVVTKPMMDRALDCEVLAEEVRRITPCLETAPSVAKAVRRALELAGPKDGVCAAGSLFLVGEILKMRARSVDALFGLN